MSLRIRTDPSGSPICPSTAFPCQRRFARPPNEMQTPQTFGVCRTRMPRCTYMGGSFRPHFAGARAKRRKSFRTDLQPLASSKTFSVIAVDWTISDLTSVPSDIPTDLDRSQVNTSHDVTVYNTDNGPKERLCEHGQQIEIGEQRKQEWKARTLRLGFL